MAQRNNKGQFSKGNNARGEHKKRQLESKKLLDEHDKKWLDAQDMLVNQLLEDLESGQLTPQQKIQFLSTISPYTKTKATKDLAKKAKATKNEITVKLPKNSEDLPS